MGGRIEHTAMGSTRSHAGPNEGLFKSIRIKIYILTDGCAQLSGDKTKRTRNLNRPSVV